MRFRFIPALLLFFFQSVAQQSKPAFWSDIQAFKKQDSASFPKPQQILLIGSSSFTKWTDVQKYFPTYPVLNRGFGGSTLVDLIRYTDDIVFPYRPKQIIVYCGENDFAANDSVSVNTVANRFKQLFQLIRNQYGDVPIAYISMKPSPSREKLLAKFVEANGLIKNFLQTQKNTAFINVYNKMLKPDGTPMDDIFLEDKLHMNAKGYAIWQKIIEPYLVK
jgi:lysophospholipase L1-like esterase